MQIADDIKGQIIAGKLQELDKLPSIRECSTQYAVTALTMQRAMGLLESEGIIQTRKGVGSFVQEGIQEKLKSSMLTEHVQTFITQLTRMGLSNKEILALVKEALSDG